MNYTRQYENRINWQNTPSVSTPINATNLNKMDNALNYMDGKMAEAAGAINNSFVLAGAGRELSYNNSIVDTDIYLHRAPKAGDRLLLKMSSTVTSSPQVKIYDEDGGTAYTLSFAFWGSFMALKGLCLIEVVDDDGLQLVLAYSFNGTEYTAGTGISISNGYINNTMPQLGVNTGYSEVTSVSSGNLGTVDEDAEYFFLNFKTNASPSSGKYTIMLASGMSFKYGLLKDRSGNDFSKNLYSGMVLLCKKESSGTGTEQDPVLITVLSITNWYVEIGRKANTTVGVGTTAEGRDTTASGQYSHAEGMDTVASGNRSHAEGQETTASGGISHAEGLDTIASGSYAHAEGNATQASGTSAHAEGDHTQAVAAYTHAGGHGTIASYEAMTAIGKYNKSDTYGTLFEIGNGTDGSHRSNAFAVNDSGNAIASGNVSAGGNLTAGGTVQDGNGNDLAEVAALETSASGNPIIVNAQPVDAKSLSVNLEPIQDLHGYDKPWVGGSGKNKLPLTLANIKALNTSGTWSGNTYTKNGLTFKCEANQEGYLTKVTANGTATAETALRLLQTSIDFPSGSIASGITGGSANTYLLEFVPSSYTGRTYVTNGSTALNNTNVFIIEFTIRNGVSISNIVAEPMIRLSTESDATFAPYSNICPISGRTETSVASIPKADYAPFFEGVKNGTYGFVDLGSLEWNVSTAGTNKRFYSNGIKTLIKSPSNPSLLCNSICSAPYSQVDFGTAYAANVDKVFSITDMSSVNYGNVNVIDTNYNDVATFTTAMSGVYLIYELATPTTPSYTAEQWAALVNSFSGITVTIQLGQTVYGGTVNLVTGKCTIDKVIKTFTATTHINKISNTNWYVDTDTSIKRDTDTPCISNKFKAWDGTESQYGGGICFVNANGAIRFNTVQEFSTVADMFAAIGNLEFCCKLATPITIQLTPAQLELLKGDNYITADGEMELVYIPESILPTPPTTDGTYKLICTVSNGVPTFSWAAN